MGKILLGDESPDLWLPYAKKTLAEMRALRVPAFSKWVKKPRPDVTVELLLTASPLTDRITIKVDPYTMVVWLDDKDGQIACVGFKPSIGWAVVKRGYDSLPDDAKNTWGSYAANTARVLHSYDVDWVLSIAGNRICKRLGRQMAISGPTALLYDEVGIDYDDTPLLRTDVQYELSPSGVSPYPRFRLQLDTEEGAPVSDCNVLGTSPDVADWSKYPNITQWLMWFIPGVKAGDRSTVRTYAIALQWPELVRAVPANISEGVETLATPDKCIMNAFNADGGTAATTKTAAVFSGHEVSVPTTTTDNSMLGSAQDLMLLPYGETYGVGTILENTFYQKYLTTMEFTVTDPDTEEEHIATLEDYMCLRDEGPMFDEGGASNKVLGQASGAFILTFGGFDEIYMYLGALPIERVHDNGYFQSNQTPQTLDMGEYKSIHLVQHPNNLLGSFFHMAEYNDFCAVVGGKYVLFGIHTRATHNTSYVGSSSSQYVDGESVTHTATVDQRALQMETFVTRSYASSATGPFTTQKITIPTFATTRSSLSTVSYTHAAHKLAFLPEDSVTHHGTHLWLFPDRDEPNITQLRKVFAGDIGDTPLVIAQTGRITVSDCPDFPSSTYPCIRSTDGGVTWEEVDDLEDYYCGPAHCVVQRKPKEDPADPDEYEDDPAHRMDAVVAEKATGKCFMAWSTDYGEHWTIGASQVGSLPVRYIPQYQIYSTPDMEYLPNDIE